MFSRLIIVSLFLLAGVSSTRADEFDTLRLKWRDLIVGTGYDTADPDVAARLTSIGNAANGYWSGMNQSPGRTYLWSDIASTTDSEHITTNYIRLNAMALAYATPGCWLQGNAALLADTISALDWMNANRYGASTAQYSNWYPWEIGSPLQLTDICVLLYDQLTPTQRTRYMDAVEHQTPIPDMTQANLMWKARIVGLRGCIVKSSAKLVLARDAFSALFPYVTSNDGFYTDGSFIQHTNFAYTAGYGAGLLSNMVPVLSWLSGSTWQVTDPAQANLYQWVYQSFEPIIYRGAAWDSVRGRELAYVNGSPQKTGHEIMDAILQITRFAPPADVARMKAMVKYWAQADTVSDFVGERPLATLPMAKALMADPSVTPRGELIGHYNFAAMDRVIHLGKGYGFGLGMCSSRISNFESINGENLQGWFTGDGMTILYNADLNAFGDAYWPTIDPYRLPGVTADPTHNKLPPTPASGGSRAQGQNTKSPNHWVGGATLDRFGSAGMELKGVGVTLAGKKSWFMFDDEIVCLGAGITSSDSRPIETTVENRKLTSAGTNAFTVDGVAKSTATGWSETMTGVTWAHLAGTTAGADIGYYFPQPASLRAVREARTGSWGNIYEGASATPIIRNYLRFGFEHGSNPTAATYQYVMLPGRSALHTDHYAEAPQITVIANDANVQAVSETTLGITAANFWTDSPQTAGIITANRKASVLVRNDGDFVDVSVSDPTQANTGTIELEIASPASAVISSDGGVSVTQTSPAISMSVNVSGARGKTFRARFYTGTPQVINLAPVADAYVHDSVANASINFGTAALLAVKKGPATFNREAFLRFEVPPWSGKLLTAQLKLMPLLATVPGIHGVSFVSDNSWIESGSGGLTWNNKPASSGAVLSTWTPAAGVQTRADVIDAITGSGLVSFRVQAVTETSNGIVNYASRESGTMTDRPQLALTIAQAPPTVELASPEDGAVISRAGEISITADAQGTDGAIAGVSIYDGGTLLGTATTPPYAITASLVGGPHLLSAVATDSNGLTRTSLTHRIDVAYPPTAATISIATGQNTPIDVDLRKLVSDVETPTANLRFSLGMVTNGSAVLLPDGYTVRFTPASNYSGPATFAYSVTDAPADERIVLNYDFQAASATDVSGHGRDGFVNIQGSGSASYPADVPSPLAPQQIKSLRLTENGSAGAARVEIDAADTGLDLRSSDWTISGWFKRTSTENIDTILQLGWSAGYNSNALTLMMDSGANRINLHNYAGAVGDVSILKSDVAAGVWQHFAVVRDGTTLNLYLNGEPVGSDSSFSFTFDPTSPVKFGGLYTDTTASSWERWFNGSLADLAIFSGALDGAEVSRLSTLPVANFAGQSAEGSVNISVLHSPTAVSASINTQLGTPVEIDLLTLASDVETPGPQLRFTVSSAVHGSAILLADGHTARFTPAAGYTGSATFDYTVTDATDDPRTFLNYRFQSASAEDSSGNGRDGTLNLQGTGGVALNASVPAALAPQISNSLFLSENGSAGAARIERSVASAELDWLTADWSVAGWFKRTSTTDIDTVFQLGNSGGWGDNAFSLVLPAGSTSIELRNYAGAVGDVYIIKTGVVTGQWHHFAIVRSGSTVSFYLNGNLVESDSAFNFTFDPTKPMKLGGVNSGTYASHWERWLDGGLADFAVFNAALIPDEVTRLATGPTANFGGQSAGNSVAVSVSLPTLYDTWISTGYPYLLGGDKLPTADPDGDGYSNILEFVLGGVPNLPDPDIRPTVKVVGANLVFLFRRADIAAYLNPVAEYSADLKVWTTAQNGVNGVTIDVVDDGIGLGIDEVTVTVPRNLGINGINGKLFMRLRAQSGAQTGGAAPLVTVFADQPGPSIDPRFFGAGVMYWNEDDNALADGQIASKLDAMKCRLLRFPGGTESDNYLWNTHLLADNRRWPWIDGPGTTDTDEFIAFCREVGADPLLCVNTEIAAFQSLEAGVQLAADWVYYCNVVKNYGVVYWEIGNEPYYHTRFTPAEYGQLFLAYARAMKAVDPNIKVVAVGDWKVASRGMKERIPENLRAAAMQAEYANEIGTLPAVSLDAYTTRTDGVRWWKTVLETAGSEIDVASFHFYFAPDYELPQLTQGLADLQSLLVEKVPEKPIPLICTEWAMGDWVDVFGLQRALAVGEAAAKMLQGGVAMGTYWPLSAKGPHERKSLLNSWTREPTANYQVLSLMAGTVGARCIGSANGDTGIYSFASQSADGHGVTLYLINRSANTHESLQVAYPGLLAGGFEAKLLSATDPASDGTTLTNIPCVATAYGCVLRLPAWSMVVVRCSM